MESVTSVCGIDVLDGWVLVQRDQGKVHILPGGRRETGDRQEATLRREGREEPGGTVGSVSTGGFMRDHYHFPHLDRR